MTDTPLRGNSLGDSQRLSPSDTLGIDLAGHINACASNQIRARVYLEVHGATGKGLE